VVAKRVWPTEKFPDIALEQEERAARHLGPPIDEKALYEFIPPTQDQLFVDAVGRPSSGLPQESSSVARGLIEQLGEPWLHHSVELLRGFDERSELLAVGRDRYRLFPSSGLLFFHIDPLTLSLKATLEALPE
jgi:hypothetical protein